MFPDGPKKSSIGRHALRVVVAIVFAVVMSIPGLSHALPAMATTPPGNCDVSEDGQRAYSGFILYECRCEIVSNGTDVVCSWQVVSKDALQANANGLYASTELGYGGSYYAMLRARSGSIGPWEQYTLGGSGDGSTWTLRSLANGLYVSAEFGYSGAYFGMLRARASVIGDYEKFYLYQIGSMYAFQSYTQPGTCCYVSTEIGNGGFSYAMLRARAYSVGGWEQYRLVGLGGSAATSSTTSGTTIRALASTTPCSSGTATGVKPASVDKSSAQCVRLVPPTS